MLSDSIIEGVWTAKDAIAASCDYNPEKLAEMLKNSSLSKGVKTVDLHIRRKKLYSEQRESMATLCVAEEGAEYKTKGG